MDDLIIDVGGGEGERTAAEVVVGWRGGHKPAAPLVHLDRVRVRVRVSLTLP